MGRKRLFGKWLLAPPLSGKLAIACTVAAIGMPTLIRHAVDGRVMGENCLAYCPFVLVSAILTGWRYAGLVAVGSVIVCDYLFMGVPNRLFETDSSWFATDWYAHVVFLSYCVLSIGVVEAVRKMVANYPRRADPDEESSGIIFSLEDGQAWASWSGGDAPVPLGPCDEVVEMMEDFLAQVELGKRLTARTASARR
jgi:hypothetical protein